MRTAELAVTKFNISVVVVNSWNAIIYKFFRGILPRMHERSTNGVIHSMQSFNRVSMDFIRR